MNENLNLVEILKNVPRGTKLWSSVHGDVTLQKVDNARERYPIVIKKKDDYAECFTKEGRMLVEYPGECVLFPSKEQRDWSKFKVGKQKVKVTLHPFDRVLGRDFDSNKIWRIDFFIQYDERESDDNYPCKCIGYRWMQVIPYNENTAHLLGTTDECPIDYELTYSKEYRPM